ncbi:hypothetical protein EVAR_21617_1 [Eumeta japonica]|uniref:Uncharacterized protein n=1 Tax=Eumeta variegata TaxID=151549 RepID=A0A4C1UY25_EUMVA|nr:hypothetical protein EVAR_21617_1 [Eumeta japonica]
MNIKINSSNRSVHAQLKGVETSRVVRRHSWMSIQGKPNASSFDRPEIQFVVELPAHIGARGRGPARLYPVARRPAGGAFYVCNTVML